MAKDRYKKRIKKGQRERGGGYLAEANLTRDSRTVDMTGTE